MFVSRGAAGTLRRRRIILVEFVVGALALTVIGVVVLTTSQRWASLLLAVWMVIVGLNYVPLALHAVDLSRPGRLAAALEGVDVQRALRHYTVAQLWVFVPLSSVVMDLGARHR